MMTVKQLIEKLNEFDPDREVRITCLAETTGTIKQGDIEDAPISFVSDNACLNGYKEPTIHISLFDDEAMKEIFPEED